MNMLIKQCTDALTHARGARSHAHTHLFLSARVQISAYVHALVAVFSLPPRHTPVRMLSAHASLHGFGWVNRGVHGLRSYVYAEVCVRSASVHMREHTAHIKTYQQVGLAFNGTAFVRVNPRKGVAAPAQTHTPQPADDTRAYISCIPARKMGEDRGNMRTVNEQNHHRDKDFKSREHCIMPPSGCPGARSPGVAKMHCCNLVVRSLNISTGTTNTSSSPGIEVVLASEHECI